MDISNIRNVKIKNAKRRTTVIIVALLFALFIAGMIYVTVALFGLESVEIAGLNKYSVSEIEASLGFTDKTNLFYLNSKKLAEKIEKEFPYIENLIVEKEFPHSLKLYAEETDGKYLIESAGKFLILSENLKVLESQAVASDDYLFVVYECDREQETGTEFLFEKSIDAEVFNSIVTALHEAEIYDAVTEIDFDDKFDISVTYDGRIRIKFESYEQVSEKIMFAARIVTQKGSDERGTLYVPTTEKATFEADR